MTNYSFYDKITYDNYGNRTQKGNTTYSWTRGRLLESINGMAYFAYDANGIRYRKTVGWLSTDYYYNGDRLIAEKRSNLENPILYFYDESGVCGMRYKGTNFEFQKNIFVDVIAIYQGEKCVGKYAYDAWGNCTYLNITYVGDVDDDGTIITGADSTPICKINPFRYRGYYYDEESKLYYLMSRYYDPEIGQFISPDTFDYLAPETIGGVNLYAYCRNNPIKLINNTFISGGATLFIDKVISKNKEQTIPLLSTTSTNTITMRHHTISLFNSAFMKAIGNVSYTYTKQLGDVNGFYQYTNTGNGNTSVGVGFNLYDWYGVSMYVSDNLAVGVSGQFTPYLTFGSELSFNDGVSASIGIINGDITHEVSVSVGWGTIGGYAASIAVAALPIPGSKVVGGIMAFIVTIFS